jgi:hypothetical protein
MTRRETNQAAIDQDDFSLGLQAWVESAVPEERGSRVDAMRRMIEARRDRSTELSLDGLGLSSIPEQIGDLADLTSLNLNNNLLTTVHARIGNLAALKTLHISYNPQLNMIPEEISNLKALTHLYIFHNQLTTIPEGIVSLPNLERLDLRGNNQLTPSPALIDRLSELETRGCDVRYPDQISIGVRKSRQQEGLKLVLETLSVASYDPQSNFSKLSPGAILEILQFTSNTSLLSESEKEEVHKSVREALEETDQYKKYVGKNSRAADQGLARAPSSTVKLEESNSMADSKGTNKPSGRD